MKRFVLNCLKYSALLLLASVLFLGALLSVPNNYIRLSYFGVSTQRQIERAKTIDEPKIVFVGGSNCSCGLCSPMVSEHFNMPVCNTGVNYIFGLAAHVQLYKEFIKPGDVVVVMPEYQQFFGDLYLGNEEYLGLLSTIYPRGFKNLTFRQQWHLLPSVPRAFEAALEMRNKHPIGDIYVPDALNEYGDVERYDLRRHDQNHDWKPTEFGESKLQKGAINVLSDFDDYCKAHHATLLVIPPGYKAVNFDANREAIDLVWHALKENGLPVFSSPERYKLADSLHFDSEYHLTYEGTLVRTSLLIEDMERALQNRN